jgi:hypothetical protein
VTGAGCAIGATGFEGGGGVPAGDEPVGAGVPPAREVVEAGE